MFVLETKRLLLKEYKAQDIIPLHHILSDRETMKFYPATFNIQQTENWIIRNQVRYKKDGHGLWPCQHI